MTLENTIYTTSGHSHRHPSSSEATSSHLAHETYSDHDKHSASQGHLAAQRHRPLSASSTPSYDAYSARAVRLDAGKTHIALTRRALHYRSFVARCHGSLTRGAERPHWHCDVDSLRTLLLQGVRGRDIVLWVLPDAPRDLAQHPFVQDLMRQGATLHTDPEIERAKHLRALQDEDL